jgi:tRNA-2-methylthio-N6-dimethylallyladenosine synthase
MPGQMVGKSDHLHAVHVTGGNLSAGDLAQVEIVESGPNSLGGRILAA